jgi:hypothetical protein
MLMKDDKKKSVSLIMGKLMGQPEQAPTTDGVEQDDSMAVDTAAEELISAIHAKSAKGVVQALKSLMEMMDDDSQPESEPSEPQQP